MPHEPDLGDKDTPGSAVQLGSKPEALQGHGGRAGEDLPSGRSSRTLSGRTRWKTSLRDRRNTLSERTTLNTAAGQRVK